MNSPLDELLKQHEAANTKYAKLFAAVKAISKQRDLAMRERDAIRAQINTLTGKTITVGTLVSNLTSTRFYEIEQINSLRREDENEPCSYLGHRVSLVNGDFTKFQRGINRFPELRTWHLATGSVIAVDPSHPIYPKWVAHKLRRRMEGDKTT